MGSARETDKLSSIDDDQDMDTEIDMDDDEILFDDFDGEDPDSEIEETAPVQMSGWRRIEMLRENRLLQCELADMDDDDWFEFSSDDGHSSHSI